MVRGLEHMICEKEMEGTRLVQPAEEKVFGGESFINSGRSVTKETASAPPRSIQLKDKMQPLRVTTGEVQIEHKEKILHNERGQTLENPWRFSKLVRARP